MASSCRPMRIVPRMNNEMNVSFMANADSVGQAASSWGRLPACRHPAGWKPAPRSMTNLEGAESLGRLVVDALGADVLRHLPGDTLEEAVHFRRVPLGH